MKFFPEANLTQFFGIYRAEVVDNNDPAKLCRLKVKVYSLFQNIPINDLPWAFPCFPFGGKGNIGSIFIPPRESTVWVAFEEGNPNIPVWIGTYYGTPNNAPETPNIFQGKTGDVSQNDTEPLINEPGAWKAQYPTNFGIRTPNGIVIEYDDTPENRRIHLFHPSGSHLEFRQNGDVVLHVKGNYHVVVDGNVEELYKKKHHQVIVQDETLTTMGGQIVTVLQNRNTLINMNDNKQTGMNSTETTGLIHQVIAGSAHSTKAPIITHTP
jgi:hypothetical protein